METEVKGWLRRLSKENANRQNHSRAQIPLRHTFARAAQEAAAPADSVCQLKTEHQGRLFKTKDDCSRMFH
jgi:hypothetical protein